MSRGFSIRRSGGPLGLFHLSLGGDGRDVGLGSAPRAGHAGKQGLPEQKGPMQAAPGATQQGTCHAVQASSTGLEGIISEVWSELHASQRPRMQEPPSIQELAQSLASRLGHEAGTHVVLRTCRNCAQGSCFARAAHSFILLEREGHPPLIVDPSFQAQFHLGRNDDIYCSFLATVPPLFVGTPGALEELVNACAAAMAAAFSRQSMPTPPWRQGHVMLCRWRPQHYTDTPFAPRTATPSLTSPFASSAQQQQQQEPPTASPAALLPGGPYSSGHPEPHPQPLTARNSKQMPRLQSSTLRSSTLKRMSSKQAECSTPPRHAIVIGFNPPGTLTPPSAAHPHPHPRMPGAKRPSQLHQRRCGSPYASRHGHQAHALFAGSQPPTGAADGSKGHAGEAASCIAKPVAVAPGDNAAAAAGASANGAGRVCLEGAAHSNSSTHAAATAGGPVAAAAAAAQLQPPAVGPAHTRPAFLNMEAGAIVNVYPCSEPASLVQPGAGLLATQSLSHTESGLLDEAAQQQQAQEEQLELAKKGGPAQQQEEQLELAKKGDPAQQQEEQLEAPKQQQQQQPEHLEAKEQQQEQLELSNDSPAQQQQVQTGQQVAQKQQEPEQQLLWPFKEELPKQGGSQQPEQLGALKQQQTGTHVNMGGAGAYSGGKEAADRDGLQLSQPMLQKAAPNRGCLDLLPPVYKVRLGRN